MSRSTLPYDLTIALPDPDQLRAAIDATDRQARFLRRLLRLSVQLQAQQSPSEHSSAILRPLSADEASR